MVAVIEYVPYKIHTMSIFWDKAILYTKRFCIKTTKFPLRCIRRAEIHTQVIQVTFTSGISLLRIVWIRRSLVSITAICWRCLPTSSLNHCKFHFFYVSEKSLLDGCTSTSCKIIFHFQRRIALKTISLETNQKLSKR